MVLLKNDQHILPLRNVKTLAVIGPNAQSLIALEANYNGVPSRPVLPLGGIEREFASARVLYAQGAPYVEGVSLPVPHCAACEGRILRQRELHWRAAADAE
jgi:beta-glucosidase